MRRWLKRLRGATVDAKWYTEERNWGDALNPYLIAALSGARVRFSADPRREKYLVVGSIMHMADANTVVWGAGCLRSNLKLASPPKRVCAVRGPLTRDALLSLGVDVPEVYGDPALLMPLLYNPELPLRYDIGIVPHYVDKRSEWVRRQGRRPGVLVIDVRSGVRSFVRQVKQCRCVISSSLHGLICADAYGVPSVWVEFSGEVLGDGFKFFDYLLSVGRSAQRGPRVQDSTLLEDVLERVERSPLRIDLERLIAACPFRRGGSLPEASGRAAVTVGAPAQGFSAQQHSMV